MQIKVREKKRKKRKKIAKRENERKKKKIIKKGILGRKNNKSWSVDMFLYLKKKWPWVFILGYWHGWPSTCTLSYTLFSNLIFILHL